MTKTCQHCGEETGCRSFLVRVSVLAGEMGDTEEIAIMSLSTRERAMAILAEVEARVSMDTRKGEK